MAIGQVCSHSNQRGTSAPAKAMLLNAPTSIARPGNRSGSRLHRTLPTVIGETGGCFKRALGDYPQ